MTWQSWPRASFRQAGPGELLEERPSIACAVGLDDKLDWIVCRLDHETSQRRRPLLSCEKHRRYRRCKPLPCGDFPDGQSSPRMLPAEEPQA